MYTGLTRSTNQILEEQQRITEQDVKQRQTLRAMTSLAQQLRAALADDNLACFGEILHEGWLLKRQLARQISNDVIDDWYQRARQHGAVGGKVLGAGGGGFLLLYACPEAQRKSSGLCPSCAHSRSNSNRRAAKSSMWKR